MRIWLINHYGALPSQAAGTRHYVLARELIRRGHEATLIASSFDHQARRQTRLEPGEAWKLETIQEAPFLCLRTPPYRGNSPARIWNMIVFAIRVWASKGVKQLEKPDVILGSSPHLFAAIAAERLANRFKVPFLLEVRDLWPQSLVELGNFSPRHPFIRVLAWIERYLYRRAERIITLLPGAGEYMVGKGAQRDRIVWLPNGVDLSTGQTPAPPSSDGLFTVMYAGAHGQANDLDTVVDAAALLQREGWAKRIRFRMIGDGPEKPRLRQRVHDERIEIVRFEDPVPKRQVYETLQEADAFLMVLRDSPLFRWGISPNKLFDYLASARPVVFAVNSPYNPVEKVAAGVTVPPGSARGMADAIKHLATISLAERWEMGLRGRRYVEEHHDMAKLAEKLERVIDEVTSP